MIRPGDGRACVALLLACGAAAANAQTISGAGTRPCSAFNTAATQASSVALDGFVSWSQGFISAFNWANVRQQDMRIDPAALTAWLAEFCAADPSQPVYRGVQELIARNAR